MAKRPRTGRTEATHPPTVHQNFFLKRDQMEVAESIVPGATERMLAAFEAQQKHDHEMDRAILELHRCNQKQERSDSWKGFTFVILVVGVLAYFLAIGNLGAAAVFGGVFLGLAAVVRAFRRKG